MTRNNDIRCEDIEACTHELEIPISADGEILYWRCRCGAKQEKPHQLPKRRYPDVTKKRKQQL